MLEFRVQFAVKFSLQRLEGKPGKRRILGLTIVFEDNFNDVKIPHKFPSQQGFTAYLIKHMNLWGEYPKSNLQQIV